MGRYEVRDKNNNTWSNWGARETLLGLRMVTEKKKKEKIIIHSRPTYIICPALLLLWVCIGLGFGLGDACGRSIGTIAWWERLLVMFGSVSHATLFSFHFQFWVWTIHTLWVDGMAVIYRASSSLYRRGQA
jgi:hypothetical protein